MNYIYAWHEIPSGTSLLIAQVPAIHGHFNTVMTEAPFIGRYIFSAIWTEQGLPSPTLPPFRQYIICERVS